MAFFSQLLNIGCIHIKFDVNGENTVGEYLSFRLPTILLSLVLTFGYLLFTCRPQVFRVLHFLSLVYIKAPTN